MRVKAIVCISGADHTINVGDEVEMEDAEAVRHIQAGHAVPVAPKVERAVKAAPETRKR